MKFASRILIALFAVAGAIVKNRAIPVVLDGYINPASSRNLEIDSKLITGAGTP